MTKSSWITNWCTAVGAMLALSGMVGCSSGGSSSTTVDSGQLPEAAVHTDAAKDVAVPTCASGQKSCNGVCTTVASDPDHCGACATSCTGGQVCSMGLCSLYCAGGTTACNKACVNETNDTANCGACGKACGAGQVCSQGACASTCSGTETTCGGGDAGAAYCADEQTDNANCGACGVLCGAGEACVAGVCGVSCPANEHLCGPSGDAGKSDASAPYCVNENTDNGNCGACGKACAAGQICAGGVCTGNCGPGSTLCTSDAGAAPYCATTATDNNNCGTCGTVCGAQQTCQAGTCVSSCVTGQTLCPAVGTNPAYCANESNDNSNCGACGTTCGAEQLCTSGMCASSCVTGQTLCPAVGANPAYCANESNDNSNCGACGTTCGAEQLCTSGMCASSCVTGQTLCPAVGANPAYCANETNDDANCGGCGVACTGGEACSGGKCACPANQQVCGGTCTNIADDPGNCGGCGKACLTGGACLGGACVCPAGDTACGTTCVDTSTNDSNCGSCGHACGATTTCSAGACSLATTTAVVVSGVQSCTTQFSNTGRKVAIDANDTIYAGMLCGTTAEIAVSSNDGNSFGAPVPIPVANARDLQIVGGAKGVAYLAVADTGSNVWFTSTANSGASWTVPVELGGGASTWISLATSGTYVYVAVGGNYTLYTSSALGVGPFTTTNTGFGTVFGDVAVDPATGNVWALWDTGVGNSSVSVNHGASFAAQTTYASMGSEFSDWVIGGGYIFESSYPFNPTGTGVEVSVVSLATPTLSSPVTGVQTTGASEQEAISADALGNAYVVQGTGTAISVQQIFATTLSAGAAVAIGNGTYPGIVAAPGGAVVIYTSGTSVYVKVQAL